MGEGANPLANIAYGFEQPKGGGDAHHAPYSHLLLEQEAELAAAIGEAVGELIDMAWHPSGKSMEGGLAKVADIYEGDLLGLETHGEIKMAFDTLGHKAIILLTRTIDTGGAQDDAVRENGEQALLCLVFGASVGGGGYGAAGMAILHGYGAERTH